MRDSGSGFSLLEVLVAVSILGGCLALIVSLFGEGLNSVGLARDYTRAALTARSLLVRCLTDPNLKVGTYQGEENGGPWTVTVSNYAGANVPHPDDPAQLLGVKISVSWRSRGGEKTLTVESLRAVAGADERIMAGGTGAPSPYTGRFRRLPPPEEGREPRRR